MKQLAVLLSQQLTVLMVKEKLDVCHDCTCAKSAYGPKMGLLLAVSAR